MLALRFNAGAQVVAAKAVDHAVVPAAPSHVCAHVSMPLPAASAPLIVLLRLPPCLLPPSPTHPPTRRQGVTLSDRKNNLMEKARACWWFGSSAVTKLRKDIKGLITKLSNDHLVLARESLPNVLDLGWVPPEAPRLLPSRSRAAASVDDDAVMVESVDKGGGSKRALRPGAAEDVHRVYSSSSSDDDVEEVQGSDSNTKPVRTSAKVPFSGALVRRYGSGRRRADPSDPTLARLTSPRAAPALPSPGSSPDTDGNCGGTFPATNSSSGVLAQVTADVVPGKERKLGKARTPEAGQCAAPVAAPSDVLSPAAAEEEPAHTGDASQSSGARACPPPRPLPARAAVPVTSKAKPPSFIFLPVRCSSEARAASHQPGAGTVVDVVDVDVESGGEPAGSGPLIPNVPLPPASDGGSHPSLAKRASATAQTEEAQRVKKRHRMSQGAGVEAPVDPTHTMEAMLMPLPMVSPVLPPKPRRERAVSNVAVKAACGRQVGVLDDGSADVVAASASVSGSASMSVESVVPVVRRAPSPPDATDSDDFERPEKGKRHKRSKPRGGHG